MARSFLPQPLPAFATFVSNFSTLVTANPGLYGLVAGDATSIAAATATFTAAYALSTAPSTRTKTTIATTITARNTLVQIVRGYGRIILANAGVADADKVALGLIIRDTVNTKIPPPSTNPLLSLIGATPGQLTLSFKDSAAGGNVKAKPFGASQMQLFIFFGTVAPVSAEATPFYGVFTKTPLAVDCPAGSAGQRAYCYARWMNAKGQVGPWSPLLQTAVI